MGGYIVEQRSEYCFAVLGPNPNAGQSVGSYTGKYLTICTTDGREDADMIARALNAYPAIKGALGTDEDGDALIEVARNAHRAEQELAALKLNPDDEPPPPDVNYDCDPIADQRMDASDFERDKPSHA